MTTRRNFPRRDPGPRVPPEGVRLRGLRAKKPAKAKAQRKREPRDFVVRRVVSTPENAESLQRSAALSYDHMELAGLEPLFGVSGWVVSSMDPVPSVPDPVSRTKDPLPSGYAWVSALSTLGFTVVRTPGVLGRGHVTILLDDPVSEEQAGLFNSAFGFGGRS